MGYVCRAVTQVYYVRRRPSPYDLNPSLKNRSRDKVQTWKDAAKQQKDEEEAGRVKSNGSKKNAQESVKGIQE